ncbi:MAG TPA: SDR family NAD(P)-dependent oxidoreductase [Gemmatimonadaceae bacterium]|jgi:NAD(P)-dependent dehydrogenase (short-subunit alcohol dehydrogenase family)
MANNARFLEGQHAVVTGGSRGIGAAIAGDLARAGASVTLMSRSGDSLRQQADSLKKEARARVGYAECDVTDGSAIKSAMASATKESGPVTILINNAGAAEGAPFAKMTREIWDRMISVNLTSAFLFSVEVIPTMLEARQGRIVNVSSTAGLRGYKTMTAYCAAKHGVIGLTRALALETAKHGVTVNAVCPGYTDTQLTDGSVEKLAGVFGQTLEEARAMLVRTIPRGSLITPEEVASAVTWLCSPAAAGVTGIALPIAGGEV